jgi:predicted dehydrogenase
MNSKGIIMKNLSRRGFLKRSGALAVGAMGFPYFVSASVLGKDGAVAPSNRIVLGCIGIGWMGESNMRAFMEQPDCVVAAVCDVDSSHLDSAKKLVDEKYKNTDCAAYHDFRELLARPDIDAVSVATPDHWHALVDIAAAEAGKDIYSEKPLSHNFREGRAICRAVKQYGRIWQTGSWQRSRENFRQACELVRNGLIGKVQRIEVGLPGSHSKFNYEPKDFNTTNPPKVLDYDFWLGPAPYSPYCQARVHLTWRWNLDTGGSQLMDWVGHHVDIAHWGMDWDRTGPTEIEATGEFPPAASVWNSPIRYRVTCQYPGGVTMVIAGGHKDIQGGTKWIGTDGWVRVDRGEFETHPESLKNERPPGEIRLYRSDNHHRNFLDCIRSRHETITPAETAHRSATPGHLGLIAMTIGRKIKFNPATEEILNDNMATSLLGRACRAPWQI